MQNSWIARISAWLYALVAAFLTTVAFGMLIPQVRFGLLVLLFIALWAVFVLAWHWLVFVRLEELDKKIPLSSNELRRRKKEFFDSLR